MVGRYFGLRSYATIYGITILAIATLTAVMSNGVALIYDFTGNYWYGIVICAAAFVISAASYLAMGPYPDLDQVNDKQET